MAGIKGGATHVYQKILGQLYRGSDDSLNLVAFLEDQKKEEIPLSEIFAKIGLDKQNWDFRQTVEYLEFTHLWLSVSLWSGGKGHSLRPAVGRVGPGGRKCLGGDSGV